MKGKINMRHRMWILVWVAAMVLAEACSHPNMVVLIPDPDGSVGKIEVTNAAGSVQINTADQATIVTSQQSPPGRPVPVDPGKIKSLFGDVLAIEPLPPVHVILYFKSNSTRLQPESLPRLDHALTLIQQRHARHVSVVGHSDTKGDRAANFKLSLRRALSVKNRLIKNKIPEATIDVTCHGEANPLVKTADNVSNARNRRVEIIIR